MSLTHVECSFFRKGKTGIDRSSFVALNPRSLPGSLVVGAAEAARASLGSQVACKLALEHFVSGVLQNTVPDRKQLSQAKSSHVSAVLEDSFKSANQAVYDFGHKLAAGGRLSASLLGLVLEDRQVAAARVGGGGLYLIREDQVFPFFDVKAEHGTNLVGENSTIAVELSSVPAQPGDLLLLVPSSITLDEQENLAKLSERRYDNQNNLAQAIAEDLLVDKESLSFIFAARLGPDTIYLAPSLVA